MTVGERIKQKRIDNGWSQSELALKMGYKDKTTISKIEKGLNEVNRPKLEKFANVLNTSVSYLMGWSMETWDEYQDINEYNKSMDNATEKEFAHYIKLFASLPSWEKRMIYGMIDNFITENNEEGNN